MLRILNLRVQWYCGEYANLLYIFSGTVLFRVCIDWCDVVFIINFSIYWECRW